MDFLCFAIETTKITPIVLKVPKPVIKLSESYTDADWSRGARRIRKKSYAKVFRASVRAETSRLPVCGSAARRNRRLG